MKCMRWLWPALVLGVVAVLVPAGCSISVSGGGGGGVAADVVTVEFPETGDELIVVSDSSTGDLTVSGNVASAAVTGLVMAEPGGTIEAQFDEQGRPTRAVIDGNATFAFAYNLDGSFGYTLTEDGIVISLGSNLVPNDATLDSLGLSAKAGIRAQDTSLDLFLCAGGVIEKLAQTNCSSNGFPEVPGITRLAEEVKGEKRAINAGLLICSSNDGKKLLALATRRSCGDCDEFDGQDRNTDCCKRINNAQKALNNMIAGGVAVLAEVIGDALNTIADPADLCGGTDTDTGGGDTGNTGDVYCTDPGPVIGRIELVAYRNRDGEEGTEDFGRAEIQIANEGNRLVMRWPLFSDARSVLVFRPMDNSALEGVPDIEELFGLTMTFEGQTNGVVLPTEVTYGDYFVPDTVVINGNMLPCPAPNLGSLPVGTVFSISVTSFSPVFRTPFLKFEVN